MKRLRKKFYRKIYQNLFNSIVPPKKIPPFSTDQYQSRSKTDEQKTKFIKNVDGKFACFRVSSACVCVCACVYVCVCVCKRERVGVNLILSNSLFWLEWGMSLSCIQRELHGWLAKYRLSDGFHSCFVRS